MVRQSQIELQVALINALDSGRWLARPCLRRSAGVGGNVAIWSVAWVSMHVKGQAAPETEVALERARLLIEQVEALGEPPEDPLLLSSALWLPGRELRGVNGDVMRELAAS